MHVPSNPPLYKKGDRVQERSKGDREIRTTRRQYVEGPTKYKGGRKYTIVEDPYLPDKENGAKRRMWMYKIVQDGTTKVEPKGQNMIMALEE